MEEKYGKATLPSQRVKVGVEQENSSSAGSSDETEDDEGVLANEALDQEISATLNAIRSKDPRVYDKRAKFYSEYEPEAEGRSTKDRDRVMTLKDYHRRNLLNSEGAEDHGESTLMSYARQQETLKRTLVQEMHNVVKDEAEDDEFLRPIKLSSPPPRPAIPDAAVADHDPESFLTDFLASRAWVPTEGSRFATLESDDDDEYDRGEEFEWKYNLRFEDPEEVNKTLKSYDRDAIAERTVRREDKSARKRAREKEREKRDAEQRQQEEERARLRKLKIDQVEQKVEMIRDAAGLQGKEFRIEEWAEVLDADWDDRWDQEMRKRFGDAYYQAQDEGSFDEDEAIGNKKGRSKKLRKPKWDDEIQVTDLIPDFNDSKEISSALRLSDGEVETDDDDGAEGPKKIFRSAKAEAKAAQRRNRRIISAIVDQNLPLDIEQPGAKASKSFAPFRYRETSPGSFGLTPLDILAATDAQLNQYAGLKKLAAFRDPERKRKDKKKLSKKARLREWRKDAFGSEDGPKRELLFAPGDNGQVDVVAGYSMPNETADNDMDVRDGERGKNKKKKKRRGKRAKDASMMA